MGSAIDPFDLVGSLLSGIGRAITSGLAGMARWAMDGLLSALTSTTGVDLGLVNGPWRAMVVVGAMASVPVIVVAVTQAAVRGRPGEAAARGLGAPLVGGVGLLVSRALVGGLITACTWASWELIDVGLGGSSALVTTWTKFLSAIGAGGAVVGGAEGSLGAVALMLLVTAVLAFTVWVELAVRAALLYLLATMLPLALVGLYWRRLSGWLVRLGEVIVAVALSQVIITAGFVLGTALLDHSLSPSGPDISGIVSGLGLLLLASLGLPLTLRIVPMAVDAAVHAGAAMRVTRAAEHLGSATGAGSVARLATAPLRVISGYSAGTGTAGAQRLASAGEATGAAADASRVQLLATSRAARAGARLAQRGASAPPPTPAGEPT